MRAHQRKQDFRVFFILEEGGRGSMVVKEAPGHVAACEMAGDILRRSALITGKGGWRVSRVRPLPGMTPARALAEAAAI